jgi:hypothetical protein
MSFVNKQVVDTSATPFLPCEEHAGQDLALFSNPEIAASLSDDVACMRSVVAIVVEELE